MKLSFIFKPITDAKGVIVTGRDGGYKTHQRDAVLSYLKNEGKCVGAEEIIEAMNKGEEKVSKTTVYRSLDHFVSEGSVTRYVGAAGEGATYRYNGGHTGHYHLKCTGCGSTTCVECDFMQNIEHHFLGHHGFSLDRTQTVFYGVCRKCAENR